MDREELRKKIDSTLWYHSIELPYGIKTKGLSRSDPLSGDDLPDFSNRDVLDIGAWDGLYSFMAERLGAKRVVALDHYAWCLDFNARQAYWQECRQQRKLPDLSKDLAEFWRPDAPGRRAFEIAHEVLHSKVEPVVGDFMTMDLCALGPFDITLFLGVLYHMKEPLTALEHVRAVTREVAVIETEAVRIEGYDDANLLTFFPADELGEDFGNWYVPTEAALHALCRAAGFSRSETKRTHNFKNLRRRYHVPGHVPGQRHYRLVVHAYV